MAFFGTLNRTTQELKFGKQETDSNGEITLNRTTQELKYTNRNDSRSRNNLLIAPHRN